MSVSSRRTANTRQKDCLCRAAADSLSVSSGGKRRRGLSICCASHETIPRNARTVYSRVSYERVAARVGQCAERKHRFATSPQRAAIARAFTKACTERSTCFGVVAQSQTLIRMTALPCQVEPPHQHSPELWMFCSVALVRASSSHEASTWLKTTSL
jgi:hypothetical protein